MTDQKDFFNKYGYLLVDNLFDPKDFLETPPKERGHIKYYGREDRYYHHNIEPQVNGSLARYNHPKFKYIHSQVRLKIQKILGEDLYNTYYYDRFYFAGQELKRHSDRESCEISVTYQISSNSSKPWPIYFEDLCGDDKHLSLNDGQAVIYKGCEVEHWREKLKSKNSLPKRAFNKLFFKKDDTYHHQIFFHYVRVNGIFAHHAYDTYK